MIGYAVAAALVLAWGVLIGRSYEKDDWEDPIQPVKSWKQMEKEYLEARGL